MTLDSGATAGSAPDAGAGGSGPGANSAGAGGSPVDAGATADASGGESSDAGMSDANNAGSSPCSGGTVLLASDAAGADTSVKGYAEIHFDVPTTTQLIGLQTTLTVPEKPTMSSTVYAWPGIEPGRWDNLGRSAKACCSPCSPGAHRAETMPRRTRRDGGSHRNTSTRTRPISSSTAAGRRRDRRRRRRCARHHDVAAGHGLEPGRRDQQTQRSRASTRPDGANAKLGAFRDRIAESKPAQPT